MKKRDFQKGAISVFLVIILIPCIVISGTFADLSRVKLSQGVATSAADLALNSLMANYDKDLSDFYGLMGSCQNIEEFYAESSQYFLEALYSQGLSADDAESLLAYVNTLLMDENVHDLLQMEVQTQTADIVKDFDGASLGTSSVIVKDQIVEFMKYRAPVEITSKIIKRLSDSGADTVFGNADKDEELVDDKQDYADAEEDFMDAAFKTYKALKEYEKLGLETADMEAMLSDLIYARETYREITALIVSNLHGTSGLTRFYRTTYPLTQYKFDKTNNKIYSRKEKDSSGNDVYYIDGKRITSLLDDLESKIGKFKEKRDAIPSAAGDTLVNASIGSGANQYHPIQWWAETYAKVKSPVSNFDSAAKNMLEAYAKVLAIKECTLGNDIPSDWENRYNRLTQSVTDLQKDFLTANVGEKNNNKYLRLVNKLEKHSKENVNKISPDTLKLKNGKTVSGAITDVQTKLSGSVSTLNSAINALDKLIDGTITNNPHSLVELSKKATNYKTTFNTWQGTANSSTTDMGKSDRESIEKMQKDGQVLAVSGQDVLDFKTRLVAVRQRLKDLKTTIESMKYGGKKLVDIKKYSTAYNAVKSGITDNLTNSQVANNATSLFKAKFTPYSADANAAVASFNFSDNSCNPQLSVDPPAFYTWLHNKFKNTDESKVKEKKDEVDGKEDEGEKKADEAKNKDRSTTVSQINLYGNSGTYAPEDFPSGLDANLRFSLANGIVSSLSNVVSSLVNMKFDGVRDSLYSTEYVMDMFSYHTHENEGKYNLYKDNNKKAPSSTADYSSVSEAWKSTEPTDTYNKTLTNKMIDSTYNVLYGAEVEYILYGKENKSNIAAAYTDIFTIRYLLNTLSGFQNFWTGSNTTARAIEILASSISAATSGIVPVPAIKCVAILLLTAVETANDLDRLSDGFPVELYKKEEDWRFSINKDFSVNTKSANSKDSGLFYSDYIYLFLFLGFESDSASEMYRRTADVIQANMRKYTDANSYKLKNAKSYFKLDATIRVKPLMLAMPMASDGFSNNPKNATDWCTFEIHEIRGYS